MDECQYKRLAQICDKILLDQPDNIYRIAIDWLHVPKEHAYLLAKYENPQKGLFIRFLYYLAHRLFCLSKSILLHIFSFSLHKIDKKRDLLIISHLINIEHYQREADFYFGKVNVDLDVQFLIKNHTVYSAKEIESTCQSSTHKSLASKVILPTTINPFVELFFLIKSFQQFILLFLMGLRCKESFERAVMFRAATESMSLSTFDALKMHYQIGIVLRKTKPKAILTTYEGHAWARLVCCSAKQYDPSILRLGYRHLPIFRLEHSNQRPLNTAFNPDYILTAGEIGYQQFKRMAKQLNCQFAILGNPKRINITTKNTQSVCLVLPEAIPQEYIHFFTYAIECARRHPEIMFLLRPHPNITKQQLFKQVEALNHLPPNAKLSSNPIEEDIACAKWAIYTGTSAIIQAGMAGVIPTYLKMPNPYYKIKSQLHVDILHELSDKIPQAMSYESFSQLVKTEYDVAPIVDYCQKLYSEMDYSIVKGIIEKW